MFEFLVRLTQLAAPPYSPTSVSHLHQMSQVPLCITSIIATSPMPSFFIDINNMIKKCSFKQNATYIYSSDESRFWSVQDSLKTPNELFQKAF